MNDYQTHLNFASGPCGCRWLLTLLIALSQVFVPETKCADNSETSAGNHENRRLFTLLSSEKTGIDFRNQLPEISQINILTYQYFYNGGGVAIGDINNDNLPDIYFTGNLVANRLFLNLGDLRFLDITDSARVGGKLGWTTGAAMADINADGLLDIYVCRSGKVSALERANELFINNGDLTFTEKAAEFGLADPGYSTQSAFLDFDLDGDLDMYLLNHAITAYENVDLDKIRKQHDPFVADKLYRNDGGKFLDVSAAAHLRDNPLGFGLGVSIGDLNGDGWPDIYIGNDFIEQDYLYFNNGDGTFSEKLKKATGHTSLYSMGSDISDFNNDGFLDVVVLDMAAADNYRQKTNMSGMNRRKFYAAVEHGFHYQYMNNMLQMNIGDGTFSEVSHLAGVSNTDWSWAPLFADFDNDGLKDLFVSNGYRRDATNNDYIHSLKKRFKKLEIDSRTTSFSGITTLNSGMPLVDLVRQIPSTKIPNYVFRNNGDLTFDSKADDWGMTTPSFSNGAAYADLDNDGDLDLVVNNIDDVAFVYRNEARGRSTNHYLQIELVGSEDNRFGVGARIELRSRGHLQVQEYYPTRGFQSSVGTILHFGLGKTERVEQLTIKWPDGKKQTLANVACDQRLTLSYNQADAPGRALKRTGRKLFADRTMQTNAIYKHRENKFDDFAEQSLLPHKLSRLGPAIAVADVNGDKLDDFFVGGAMGFAGVLYLQTANAGFDPAPPEPWQIDKTSEDVAATFFDADEDGDKDLYVVSGGNDFVAEVPELRDRLYFNDGHGNFSKRQEALPYMRTSSGCVTAGDFDRDGDLDLFVGGRLVPGKYPFSPRSYLLRNDNGTFVDATAEVSPALLRPGMVTSALWTDFNEDSQLDLIVAGEWMSVLMFANNQGKLKRIAPGSGLDKTTGWWYSLAQGDFDKDGDVDYIAGNLGLNYKYKTEAEQPFSVHCDDFDGNGSLDIVLGYYNNGKNFPLRGRECSSGQMPFIKEHFPTYDAFARATLDVVYGDDKLKKSLHYDAQTFASCFVENAGAGVFRVHPLPNLAQLSSITAILTDDFDGDGNRDLIIAGNLYESEVETPRNDASVGLFLRGDGKGGFEPIPPASSGLIARGNVKGLSILRLGQNKRKAILVAKNNDYLQIMEIINRENR